MAFKGQIISDEQADRMLSISHDFNWQYHPTYEMFYAFMATISEEQRSVIIRALATHHREQRKKVRATVVRAVLRETVAWENTKDWEPSECPVCKSTDISRFTIRTSQGDGTDSWLCHGCDHIIERKGVYTPKTE